MLQSKKKGRKNQVGAQGEELACTYLKQRGFTILGQNYLRKWGEIDLIAQHANDLHFIEVKTQSYETRELLERSVLTQLYRPEENVHHRKLQRLYRAIETWLAENDYQGNWQIDVAAIRLVPDVQYATIKYIPNIIE